MRQSPRCFVSDETIDKYIHRETHFLALVTRVDQEMGSRIQTNQFKLIVWPGLFGLVEGYNYSWYWAFRLNVGI